MIKLVALDVIILIRFCRITYNLLKSQSTNKNICEHKNKIKNL